MIFGKRLGSSVAITYGGYSCNLSAETPVKYEHDLQDPTDTFVMLKKSQTETPAKGVLTLTPGQHQNNTEWPRESGIFPGGSC